VFSFLAIRFAFAVLALIPFLMIGRRRAGRARGSQASGMTRGMGSFLPFDRRSLLPPLCLGLALFAGYAFQTLGLQLSTPAKTGFITGLYVVIVPLVAALALRQAPGRNTWLGVAAATVGLALLSLRPGMGISLGDALVFGCAVSFAMHILFTGRFAPHYDPLLITFGQISVVAVLCGAVALVVEQRPALTGQVLFAAAFTGILATSAAFGIQTIAQRFTTSTHTALIFSAEPVFAALASFLLIRELLGPRQILGCALILAGMLMAELKWKTREEQVG
jgi:drug/metabolite transporter (DMT)-like permease